MSCTSQDLDRADFLGSVFDEGGEGGSILLDSGHIGTDWPKVSKSSQKSTQKNNSAYVGSVAYSAVHKLLEIVQMVEKDIRLSETKKKQKKLICNVPPPQLLM